MGEYGTDMLKGNVGGTRSSEAIYSTAFEGGGGILRTNLKSLFLLSFELCLEWSITKIGV